MTSTKDPANKSGILSCNAKGLSGCHKVIQSSMVEDMQIVCCTPIQRAFTVFGPLLTEPFVHKRRTYDSCNQYMNCISKEDVLCAISMHPATEWM